MEGSTSEELVNHVLFVFLYASLNHSLLGRPIKFKDSVMISKFQLWLQNFHILNHPAEEWFASKKNHTDSNLDL